MENPIASLAMFLLLCVVLGVFFVGSYLSFPVCLAVYISVPLYFGLKWMSAFCEKRSSAAPWTFISNVLTAIKDTAIWSLWGFLVLFTLQLGINISACIASGDVVDAFDLFRWQYRAAALRDILKWPGHPIVFIATSAGFLYLTYRTRSDRSFRGWIVAKKWVSNISVALTAFVSFTYVTTEYVDHMEGIWQPQWKKIKADQGALESKLNRRISAAYWLRDWVLRAPSNERAQLSKFVATWNRSRDAVEIDRSVSTQFSAEPAEILEPEGDVSREGESFTSVATEMDRFFQGPSDLGPTAEGLQETEDILADRRELWTTAQKVSQDAFKVAIGSVVGGSSDLAVDTVVKALISSLAKTVVGSAFEPVVRRAGTALASWLPRAGGPLPDATIALSERLNNPSADAVAQGPALPVEPIADNDERWTDVGTGQRMRRDLNERWIEFKKSAGRGGWTSGRGDMNGYEERERRERTKEEFFRHGR